jgi:diguanylate cyclase (GGDEF)-like protein
VKVLLKSLREGFKPRIRDGRELRGYVFRVTLICVAVALIFDVINQTVFFVDWETSLRSWAITVMVAAVIAVPALLAIGKAHLQLYQAKLAVDELSRTDPLTGLSNRRGLLEEAEGLVPGALALVIVDIDRFKRINDAHGHLAGDDVIRAVGQAMGAELRDLGRVGRLGGEEFALLSASTATQLLASRIWGFRDRIAATPIVTSSATVRVTVSAGVAIRRAGQSFDQLYAEADRALYLAKASGRNRVVLASEMALQMHATSATGRDGPKPEPPLTARERGAGGLP